MEHHAEVSDFVNGWTKERTRAEIQDLLGGTVPFAPVYKADDIFADPHFAAREMLADVEAPGASTHITVANTPVRMSDTPGGVRRRAPLTGRGHRRHPDRIRLRGRRDRRPQQSRNGRLTGGRQ